MLRWWQIQIRILNGFSVYYQEVLCVKLQTVIELDFYADGLKIFYDV